MRNLLLSFVCLLVPFSLLAQTAPQESTPSAAETEESRPQPKTVLQRYAAKIFPHEPMYFSIGWRERTNARYQFSFKYRFINPDGALANRSGLFNNLYFGYTQTSLWDLDSNSAPFYDTSYRPSLFFYRPSVHHWSSRSWSMDIQAGIEHESNGQGGADSRSLDVFFVRPTFHLGTVFGSDFSISPKIYAYISGLSDNPDLPDYRGYVDLEIAIADETGWKFVTTLRKGSEKDYGSVLVDVTFPLDKLFAKTFDAFVHLQYFCGWGESLLSYDQKHPAQIRLGLMIVR